jgi:hypothetical protein
MSTDISERVIPVKPKLIWTTLVTAVGLTVTATTGYFSLKADVAEAKAVAVSAVTEVKVIKCLLEQQNQFHMYGVKPIRVCSDNE